MQIKDGVSLDGLHVAMRVVLAAVENIYRTHGKEPVITSGTEGDFTDKVHSLASYHYFGMALDFRTRYFSNTESLQVRQKIQNKLGNKYTAVFEGNHIHVQYNWGKF